MTEPRRGSENKNPFPTCPVEQRPTELLNAPTKVESGISGVDRPTPMLGARGPSLIQLTWKYTCLRRRNEGCGENSGQSKRRKV